MKTYMLVIATLLVAGWMLAGCQDQTVSSGQKDLQYVYTVRSTDKTFKDVAENVYGDGRLGENVANANPAMTEASLAPGQELIIPAVKGYGLPVGCDRRQIY